MNKLSQFYPIIIALVFNGLDLFSGLIQAVKLKEVKSSKLRDGLFKKVGFMLCYFVAWVVDHYGSVVGFTLSVDVLPIIVAYVCATELTSIIENICKINPDILPEKLCSIFEISGKNGD